MFHEPIKDRLAQRAQREVPPARRRLIGATEIFFVLLAFALLALVPSVAQIAPLGRSDGASAPIVWDAEYPAENFPGSAFFYLDPADPDEPAPRGNIVQTNAARPFVLRVGSNEYARALKCLTDAVYYEAANEPDAGQRAVAQVILNRMRHPTYPNSICGVIYQGSERATGCQFSYSCDGSMAGVPARASWLRAQRVAADALSGYVFAPIGLATHYHAHYVSPSWAPSLNFLGTIGAHRFYSWKGKAGQSSAFASNYAGREPFPGPKPRAWPLASATDLDPISLQKKYETEFAKTRLKAEAASRLTPDARPFINANAVYDDVMPSSASEQSVQSQVSQIKPEYQNSGTWKNYPRR